MLNEDQLNDKSYLELHEQVEEMLDKDNYDQKKLVKWFFDNNVIDDEDVIQHIIISYLENGNFTSNDLKNILKFDFNNQKKGGQNGKL